MDKTFEQFEQYVREEFTRVEQSQEKFDKRLENLEQGQEKLEQGQEKLEQNQQELSRKLVEGHTKIIQWVVGIFVGMSVIILTAGGLYISVLLSLKG